MIEYDLQRLFEHPLNLRWLIPSVIAAFGGALVGEFRVQVQSRPSAGAGVWQEELVLRWDTAILKKLHGLAAVEDDIANLLKRDEDKASRTENAAIVVAVAVMSRLEPATRFSGRSGIGTRHDYYLNETRDEMLEVAGLWEGGLPGFFEEKRAQSDKNPGLRKRWVSVTIFTETPRNQTEGLHP